MHRPGKVRHHSVAAPLDFHLCDGKMLVTCSRNNTPACGPATHTLTVVHQCAVSLCLRPSDRSDRLFALHAAMWVDG
jgi:hypothetical protein